MFSYTITKEANNTAFQNVCAALEAKGFEKERLLVDVDGSMIQMFRMHNKRVDVFNDYEVDAVYIDADIDLTEIVGGFDFRR